MKVLVVGSGGREHALCWAVAASPLCEALYCAPGNAGIAEIAQCLPTQAEDVAGIVRLARDKAIDFVIVGPEVPLVAGLADALAREGIKVFGPSAKAARLEGSKGFMKDFCQRHNIPSAAYGRFRDAAKAHAFIEAMKTPIVVKTDGLAAGKGVIIAATKDEARAAVDAMMGEKIFGAAGNEIVIEEFLEGEEASVFALCDGTRAVFIGCAQDHKRVGENDTGPNTGGMGAYSPAPIVDAAMEKKVMDTIISPTMAGMAAEGAPFAGILFAGLMIGRDGPKLLEFNVRFGDPECQAVLVRLKSDLLTALLAASDGALAHIDLRWREESALCVVMAARGYPGSYQKGTRIAGLEEAQAVEGVKVFHAGTQQKGSDIVAIGGRVLGITALGRDVAQARERAYKAVDKIDWPEGFCRRDIAARTLKK